MAQLEELCNRAFHEIRLEEYEILFSHIARRSPRLSQTALKSPGPVIQYWDRAPDEQVRAMLDATRDQCRQHAIERAFFDDDSARAFLREQFGEDHLQAYMRCIHSAQRSDFFRYCYLYLNGGMWLDADMVLIDSPAPMLAQPLPVFLQRATHGGITNWFLATPPRHPLFAELVGTCLRNLTDEARREECARNRDILTLTGVVAINRVVARYAHRSLCEKSETALPFFVIDETEHNRFIMTGGRWLGQKLQYKSDTRAWQTWCAEAEGNPLHPETLEQLMKSTDLSQR